MIKITTFTSNSQSKVPVSPYHDNTFDFKTIEAQNLDEAFRVMCMNFILNMPLATEAVHCRRKKIDLQPYFLKTFNYIILDIDKVNTLADRNKILEYFRPYTCIIGESRSYNGIDKFNLKGILATEALDYQTLRLAVSKFHADLQDICDLDECVARYTSLNAPIKHYSVIMNSQGILYKYVYFGKTAAISCSPAAMKLDFAKFLPQQASTIDELCLSIFQSMGFQALSTSGEALIFSHPSEQKTLGGFFWFRTSPYVMHHFNPARTVNIYEHVKNLQIYKDLLKNEINYRAQLSYPEVCSNIIHVNEKYLKVSPEINQAINDFLYGSSGVFKIKSPMGTGKSTIISAIIRKAQEMDIRLLVLSNRRSTAADFKKKYGLKLYSKDDYKIGDSLICQYDSLWKYNIRFFDVVIMDEFISLLLHSRSALNNGMFNIARFYGLFQKKLVIADAFLTGYENVFLTDKKENCYLLENTYRDNTQILEYEDYNYFVYKILETCKTNKCTISGTSLSFIHGLKLLFKKYKIKAITLTAETSENTKALIYKEFDKADNKKWDVLIFSPTLTVGVSNLNNVKYHFHYDTCATDVISSLQMTKRTRNAQEVHLYIKNKVRYVKTTYAEVKDDYLANATKNASMNCLFELDNYGDIKLSQVGRKAILIDTFKNILEYNHREAFKFLATLHYSADFAKVLETKEINILLPYIKENKATTLSTQRALIDDFLQLNEIERCSDFDVISDYSKLAALDEQIKSCLDCDITVQDRKEILLLGLKTKGFIDKCRAWYYAYNFSKNVLSENDLQNAITGYISTQQHLEIVKLLTKLLKYGNIVFKDYYTPKEFANFDILAIVGYHRVSNDPAKIYYALDPNVKKYFNFIKVE